MRKDYYTRRIIRIEPAGDAGWRVVFTHYGQIRMYTTHDSGVVNAFLHPDTHAGDGFKYKTIHDAARHLYKCGVTICGYCICPKQGAS